MIIKKYKNSELEEFKQTNNNFIVNDGNFNIINQLKPENGNGAIERKKKFFGMSSYSNFSSSININKLNDKTLTTSTEKLFGKTKRKKNIDMKEKKLKEIVIISSRFTIWDILLSEINCCLKKSKKLHILNKAFELIEEKMEVKNIMRNQMDVLYLKKLVLNEQLQKRIKDETETINLDEYEITNNLLEVLLNQDKDDSEDNNNNQMDKMLEDQNFEKENDVIKELKLQSEKYDKNLDKS